MTKAAFARVRTGLRGLAVQAKGAMAGLGAGLGGGFGKAGGVFALAAAIRAAVTNARELRDNMDLTPELRRNVDAVNLMSDAFNRVKVGFVNGLTGMLGSFYRGMFRVKAMMGGASWAESGSMADSALTDYGAGQEALTKLKADMRAIADAKQEYAASQNGDAALLEVLQARQTEIAKQVSAAARMSQERVDLEEKLLSITQKVDKVKESIAKSEKDAQEAAQKAYEAEQAKNAEAAQADFDKRQGLVADLRKAATDPKARRQMRDELREQDKEKRKLDKLAARADWKTRMAGQDGNANRRRFRLTKAEAMAMEAGRLDQQNDAMAQSLKNVDENTKKMLEKLTDNLRLK